jgi:hypothetical protein
MPKLKAFALIISTTILLALGFYVVQAGGGGGDGVDCSADGLADTYQSLADDYPLMGEDAAANAFALGAALQDISLACGYQPAIPEVEAQISRTLSIAPLSMVIAASSVGQDVDAALIEIEELSGDSYRGQMLYNGLEMGLDGAELGCAGCHDGTSAPLAEGTWTRVDEIRLLEPHFADYDVTHYLVESILDPQAYIVPEFETTLMPNNFWARMDAQQLADVVAYLESQDQEE